MRLSYSRGRLELSDVQADPIQQFRTWFDQAVETCPVDWFEVNGATLATSDRNGNVAARIVLLKGIQDGGVEFYTNYRSEKGRHLADNPQATMVFWWPFLQRQVRLTGSVSQVSAEKSDAYFRSRPLGSRIGAVVSPQSQVLPDRDQLEQQMQALQTQIEQGNGSGSSPNFEQAIDRPAHWGGYLISLERAEFWQGRENRLHDRIHYHRSEGDVWTIQRLAP